ncbi:hypothetical protein F5Y07DRAFT_376355 [Xylaria sp. FL0933]|nr:hypothetical protein F5Y07DRAFT_376355 [Xylaria sp. FL0933]
MWRDLAMRSITFMLVVVSFFGVGFSLSWIFACRTHPEYIWSTAGEKILEKCIDTQMLLYAQAVSDFIIDALIILMPIPLVWRLHMKIKRKPAVLGVFLTASLWVIDRHACKEADVNV